MKWRFKYQFNANASRRHCPLSKWMMHASHVLSCSLSEEPARPSGRPQRRNYGLATSSARMSCLDKSHVVRQLTRTKRRRGGGGGGGEGGSGASHNPLIRSRHVALFERGEATTNRLREGGAADWLAHLCRHRARAEIGRLEQSSTETNRTVDSTPHPAPPPLNLMSPGGAVWRGRRPGRVHDP